MFKLFVKLMVLALVLALAGPFFIKGPDGRPLIEFDDVALRWNRMTARFRPDADPLPVYRWQDEDGNWHFSDNANPDGSSELIYVDPDRNVVPYSDAIGAPGAPDAMALPGSNILEVLDDARDSRESMEKRNQEIEERTKDER